MDKDEPQVRTLRLLLASGLCASRSGHCRLTICYCVFTRSSTYSFGAYLLTKTCRGTFAAWSICCVNSSGQRLRFSGFRLCCALANGPTGFATPRPDTTVGICLGFCENPPGMLQTRRSRSIPRLILHPDAWYPGSVYPRRTAPKNAPRSPTTSSPTRIQTTIEVRYLICGVAATMPWYSTESTAFPFSQAKR